MDIVRVWINLLNPITGLTNGTRLQSAPGSSLRATAASGAKRSLTVTAKRSPQLPDLPTIGETFCIIGTYSIRNNIFDVWLILPLALLGYVWRKLNCEPSPFLLGIVLGPMMETQLRRSLTVSHGSWWIFLEHPISAGLLAVTALLLLMVALPSIGSRREKVFAEADE